MTKYILLFFGRVGLLCAFFWGVGPGVVIDRQEGVVTPLISQSFLLLFVYLVKLVITQYSSTHIEIKISVGKKKSLCVTKFSFSIRIL